MLRRCVLGACVRQSETLGIPSVEEGKIVLSFIHLLFIQYSV